MALENDIAALAGAPLFGARDPDALRLLAFAAESRDLRAGDVLFRKGDRSDGGYVVTRGTITLDAGDDGPAAVTAEPGALIGRTALFVRVQRAATATPGAPARVIRISPTLMRRVLEEFPSAVAVVRQAMIADLALFASELNAVRRRLLALDTFE